MIFFDDAGVVFHFTLPLAPPGSCSTADGMPADHDERPETWRGRTMIRRSVPKYHAPDHRER
ncbi:hypothetical protein ACG33_00935 [Steroidobacter denitrificans]|uniref:Uncharacterized protein n=1 Tax=Steroidobacter denitrificans TaxID=465721 RepID=A0A127F5I8_STEDE|nr:hypothetical protein ACG33_00935 [Steroidobacter denitrificans]